MNQLQAVRSNCNFSLDYTSGKLVPHVEVIILVAAPVYVTEGDKFAKTQEVKELRFDSTPAALTGLIKELQQLAVTLTSFEQMADGLNSVIVTNRENAV